MTTPPDARQIAEWLALFNVDGQALEVRAPKATLPGHGKLVNVVKRFLPSEVEKAAQEALTLSGRAPAVYFVMNGIKPELLKRADRKGATAADVPRRSWILFDFDPARPADCSATDAEKEAARKLMEAVRDHLESEGWPEPIEADSGNGYHLLYRIDLPCEDDDLVKRVLDSLAARFDNAACKVDRKVFDPPRLVKLYGTEARKGEATAERPHRYSRVLKVPDAIEVVPDEALQVLAAAHRAPTPPPLDLDAEIERKRAQAARGPRASGKPSGNRPNAETRALAYLAKCDPAVSGQGGHDQTFKTAVAIGPGFGLDPETAFRLLWSDFNPRCVPPWSERELRHKVEQAYKVESRRGWLLDAERERPGRNEARRPGGESAEHDAAAPAAPGKTRSNPTLDKELARLPKTDLGNAERFVRRHSRSLRYLHPWKKWLAWDGRRWRVDDTAAARRRARGTVRSILAEADTLNGDDRKALASWALASERRDRIAALLHLAEAEPGIPILPDALDADPWLFNVANGTLDLRPGALRPHRRADLITKVCPVAYDPQALCPLWDATLATFLHRADAQRQADLIGYLGRLIGMALTGVVRDHVLPVAYGTGANGKSTILGTLLDVFGPDYAMKAAPDMFMSRHGETHPTDRADLFGKRFVLAIETEAGRRLNETLVKELTGGDKIRARRMREDFCEFTPTHTVLMSTNQKPVIVGTDNGIWRRLRLIPFTVTMPDKDADKSMPDKLRAEAPGILAWCVRGCLDWQARGLDDPAEVAQATEVYRADEDVLGAFLDERCLLNPQCRSKARDPYTRYRAWSEGSGEAAMTQKRFGTALTERGFTRFTNNGTWYHGIGLHQEEPATSSP